MRTPRPLLLFLVSLVVPGSLLAQAGATPPASPPTSDPQAVALLQKSLAALLGGLPITDVTMTGTVIATVGTNSQSGTVSMVATSAGQSRVAFTFPSGGWITTSDYTLNPRISTTSGSAGTTNDSPEDLLGPHPAWFYPAFQITAALTASYVPSNYAQDIHDGAQVQHATVYPQSPMPLFRATSVGQVPLTIPSPEPNLYFGQQDLYIDPSSMYPTALVFRIRGNPSETSLPSAHPVYVPEEIRFLSYQVVQGQPVATHIQMYFADVLIYDIQISSVTFNTGVVIVAN